MPHNIKFFVWRRGNVFSIAYNLFSKMCAMAVAVESHSPALRLPRALHVHLVDGLGESDDCHGLCQLRCFGVFVSFRKNNPWTRAHPCKVLHMYASDIVRRARTKVMADVRLYFVSQHVCADEAQE